MSEQTQLTVVNASGKKAGSRDVSSEIFASDVVPHLLHQVVRWQRAKKRAGTHATKTRSEVAGGGRKPWRQKGTGNARAGSKSSPLWVGGGVAHGPKPRKYEFSLNRKEKRKALCSAISARNSEGRLLVVDDFGLKEPKTKEAATVMGALGISVGQTALVVVSNENQAAAKSFRNIAGVKVIAPEGLNVYDVIGRKYLVVDSASLEQIEKRFTE